MWHRWALDTDAPGSTSQSLRQVAKHPKTKVQITWAIWFASAADVYINDSDILMVMMIWYAWHPDSRCSVDPIPIFFFQVNYAAIFAGVSVKMQTIYITRKEAKFVSSRSHMILQDGGLYCITCRVWLISLSHWARSCLMIDAFNRILSRLHNMCCCAVFALTSHFNMHILFLQMGTREPNFGMVKWLYQLCLSLSYSLLTVTVA